jgi:hypothetical protein
MAVDLGRIGPFQIEEIASHHRLVGRLRWEIALVRDPDQTLSQTQGKADFGRAGE